MAKDSSKVQDPLFDVSNQECHMILNALALTYDLDYSEQGGCYASRNFFGEEAAKLANKIQSALWSD